MQTYSNFLQRTRLVAFFLTVATSISLAQWTTLNKLNADSLITADQKDETAVVRKLKMLSKSPSFGLDNLLANYSFLSFLQYFGDEARATNGYSLTPDFFESVIAHDPSYRDFYLFLSGAGSIYAANPTRSVKLMEEGLKQLAPNEPSDGYYIWRYKGTDELLFLGDASRAQQSFETAAAWARQSKDSDSEKFEKLSRRTAQHLSDNPDSKAAQVDAWRNILTTSINDTTRKRAVEQIQALGGKVTFSEKDGITIEFDEHLDSDG